MGGGKSGGGATEVAKPITTTTSVGNALDATQEVFEEETDALDTIDKKKLGTRGLRIPLAAESSNTSAEPTAAKGILL